MHKEHFITKHTKTAKKRCVIGLILEVLVRFVVEKKLNCVSIDNGDGFAINSAVA